MSISKRRASRTKSTEKGLNILSQAGNLFLERGFDGVSIDEIARASGVSKQTIYSHYGNKEGLFIAIIQSKIAEHDLTDELFAAERPLSDVLRDLAKHFSELLMSSDAVCMLRICVADVAQRGVIADLYWKNGPECLSSRFVDYLEYQKNQGLVRIENPHFAAQQFLSMIKADAYMRRVLDQPDDYNIEQLPAYLESCIALFKEHYL